MSTCTRCHKPLSDAFSIQRGYGPECWAEGDPPMLLRRAGPCEDCMGQAKVVSPGEKVFTETLDSAKESACPRS